MTLTVKMDKKRIPAAPQAEQNDRDNALEEDSDHKEDYTEVFFKVHILAQLCYPPRVRILLRRKRR